MTFYLFFITIFFLSHTGFMVGWILLGHLKFKRDQSVQEPIINLAQLTVIIPFRNEIKRILPLLQSIENSNLQPVKYIFVNDHSTDNTEKRIAEKLQTEYYEIFHLDDLKQGKKEAISFGVQHAQTEFVLTLDADVWFDSVYFDHISKLQQVDLQILPVRIKTSNFISEFFHQDVELAISVNVSTAGWIRPILCSGANLLFRRDSFLEETKNSNYFEKSSGDDIYLLQLFQLAGKSIQIQLDQHVAVQTPGAQSIQEYIAQRARWIGKSRHVADALTNRLVILQFLLSIGFCIALILVIQRFSLTELMFFLLVKVTIDSICLWPCYSSNQRFKMLFMVPVYIFILPFINLFLLIYSLTKTPRWKDRLVVQ
jgi:cellulose synthase/poly-beta-1,6-N-acetylglucosamine synthase-like glycosyltransferase